MSMDDLNNVVDCLQQSKAVYVIGSRLFYTFAYYLGWSLTKVRQNVHILHYQLSRFGVCKPQRRSAKSASGKTGAASRENDILFNLE